MSTRHALTDEQWGRIMDLVPGKDGDPGRSGKDNRLFIDGVLYVLKTGVPLEGSAGAFWELEFCMASI
ncbi:MAG: transposase [Planctomycetaceae bacterium]